MHLDIRMYFIDMLCGIYFMIEIKSFLKYVRKISSQMVLSFIIIKSANTNISVQKAFPLVMLKPKLETKAVTWSL